MDPKSSTETTSEAQTEETRRIENPNDAASVSSESSLSSMSSESEETGNKPTESAARTAEDENSKSSSQDTKRQDAATNEENEREEGLGASVGKYLTTIERRIVTEVFALEEENTSSKPDASNSNAIGEDSENGVGGNDIEKPAAVEDEAETSNSNAIGEDSETGVGGNDIEKPAAVEDEAETPGDEKQAYSANNEKSGERHGEGAEAVGQCEEVHEETDERKEQEDSQVDEQHNEKSQVEEHDRQASEEQPNPQAQANNETTEKRLNTPNQTQGNEDSAQQQANEDSPSDVQPRATTHELDDDKKAGTIPEREDSVENDDKEQAKGKRTSSRNKKKAQNSKQKATPKVLPDAERDSDGKISKPTNFSGYRSWKAIPDINPAKIASLKRRVQQIRKKKLLKAVTWRNQPEDRIEAFYEATLRNTSTAGQRKQSR
ncbi:hypothetical protein EIP86_000799 [Pleurotus ostreatoroseus]|nr:hypothetical protein EIP86_000799 [Pleurotus ostreatoroseus]